MKSIYEKYNLKEVINASGRMTILGVSTPVAAVIDEMNVGLQHFFEIKDLLDKTGEYIAKRLQVEAAVIVSCASSGMAQAVGALISKDDLDLILNLHTSLKIVPREIIIPKGHNVNYGAPVASMLALGGGIMVEAGYANECSMAHIETMINADTAALLYIKSHHCVQKSMPSVTEMIAISQKHKIPLIIDAAAEEDLMIYHQMGADIVIYSGAKAIEGPTSGLVIGKKTYIDWIKLQSNGIGRAMKVGKEGILGLTKAIDLYLSTPQTTGAEMLEKMKPFIDKINLLNGMSAKAVWDSAGRDIARAELYFDEKVLGKTTFEILAKLKQGSVVIYFREYKANEGKVEVDVRSVSSTQLETAYQLICTAIN